MADIVRVLVVDDDPDMLDLSATSLERTDEALTVTVEKSGDAALSSLREDSFDCVVSDYEMPGMDGLVLFRAIRDTTRPSPSSCLLAEVPSRSPPMPSPQA